MAILKTYIYAASLFASVARTATIIRQLTYHFNKILGCAAQLESGKSADEAVKSLRPPLMFYRKNSFMQQLRIWTRERLLGALSMLYDCERDCKTTNLPAEQVASYCVMRISGAARKLSAQRA